MNRKVCLILSGGAARCLAHVGVYRYLFENGYEIEAVAGSSGGSVIGAFISSGFLPSQLEYLAKKVKPLRILRPSFPPKGSLLSWKPVLEFFETFLPERFECLKKPLWVSVTDLLEGENVLLNRGNLHLAVAASSALPPFFSPVKIAGRLYVDGAFTNDLPVEPFGDWDCLKVCSDVTPLYPSSEVSGIFETTLRALIIAMRLHKEEKYPLCDVVIKPNLKGLSFVNFKNPEEYFKRGYEAAEEVFKQRNRGGVENL